jgi:PPOX class probable F420-dependent enzyme
VTVAGGLPDGPVDGGPHKTRNLRRDPTAVLCVFSDRFFGRWLQIEGTAQVVSLPEAMGGLVDYYRRISGEHPDWDDYRRAMQQQRRVLVGVATPAPARAR